MKKILLFLLSYFQVVLSQNEVCFDIEENPNINNSAFQCFSKYINVLDCFDIYAEELIPDNKVLHVAAVAAELLDNNEDGIVDDQLLFTRLQEEGALIPIFTYDGDACMYNLWTIIMVRVYQQCYGEMK